MIILSRYSLTTIIFYTLYQKKVEALELLKTILSSSSFHYMIISTHMFESILISEQKEYFDRYYWFQLQKQLNWELNLSFCYHYYMISFIFFLLALFVRVNSFSLVEGFYWDQQKEFTHKQRRSLLELLPAGGTYIYMPQIIDTLALWNSSQQTEWQNTIHYCDVRGVNIIFGLRTMFIDDLAFTLNRVEKKIQQLNASFILGWDDCPGGKTDSQKRLQLQLIQKISRKPWAVIPSAYYGQKESITRWLLQLSIINDADQSIPFILTSKAGINPFSMDPTTDFPPLKRKMIFWDNWMAVDSLDRLPRSLPRDRSSKLFFQPFGYMLNLCFPPQRIIHGIASLEYLELGINFNFEKIATIWADYLLKNLFISKDQYSEMYKVLWELIYYSNGTMEVKTLLKQYPILSTFLYTS